MQRKGYLTRTVTAEECPWLKKSLPVGKAVHAYDGCTYGCISHGGIAVVVKPWWHWILFFRKFPFCEVPADSVKWDS